MSSRDRRDRRIEMIRHMATLPDRWMFASEICPRDGKGNPVPPILNSLANHGQVEKRKSEMQPHKGYPLNQYKLNRDDVIVAKILKEVDE